MDLEIQRVARELYKALSGLNEEFENVRFYLNFSQQKDKNGFGLRG